MPAAVDSESTWVVGCGLVLREKTVVAGAVVRNRREDGSEVASRLGQAIAHLNRGGIRDRALGASGGSERHSLVTEYALRPFCSYLGAQVMTTAVFAATGDFGAEAKLDKRIDTATRELAEALVNKRVSTDEAARTLVS